MNTAKTCVNLNTALADKPNGCAIWIEWPLNMQNRIEMKYLFFGNPPGKSLPDISTHTVGKHSKANALGEKNERPATRVIKKTEFARISNMTELVKKLFIIYDPIAN